MRRAAVALAAALALVAGACGSDDTAGVDGGDDPPAAEDGAAEAGGGEASADAPTCDPARPAPEEGVQSFAHASGEREYLLALPDGYDGTTAVPLVLDFHGFGGNKELQEQGTEMAERGTARGYAVVTPDALGEPREWNMFGDPARPDDFDFALSLIAELTETLCVDADRVYADGHSNGSAFVAFLSCREPHPLAAIALVSATVPTDCGGDGPARSVIAIHGTDDPLVPYDGGDMPGGQDVPGAPGAVAATAEAYGCDPPTEDTPLDGVERTTYAGCRDGAEVVLDTIVGGRHMWPGGQGAELDEGTSQAALDYVATEAILDLFDRHTRAAGQGE